MWDETHNHSFNIDLVPLSLSLRKSIQRSLQVLPWIRPTYLNIDLALKCHRSMVFPSKLYCISRLCQLIDAEWVFMCSCEVHINRNFSLILFGLWFRLVSVFIDELAYQSFTPSDLSLLKCINWNGKSTVWSWLVQSLLARIKTRRLSMLI